MNISSKNIIGKDIFDDGKILGQVARILIDNLNGKILGVENKKGVFFARENIFLKDSKLCLRNTQNVPKNGQNWLNKRVFNQNKYKIGRVFEIFFDENFSYVVQICSIKKIVILSFNKRVFDYQSILEVNSKKIVVNDDNLIMKILPIPA